MTIITKPLTAEDLWAMSDNGGRNELINGELRMMTPAGFDHGKAGTRLLILLGKHVWERDPGDVVGADTGFVLGRDPDVVRCPDVALVSRARLPAGPIPKFFPGAPDLAVEVLSPSDTVYEVEEKLGHFMQAGTRLIWVVNPKNRTVSVYRSPNFAAPAEVIPADGNLGGGEVVPRFECRVGDLFA